MISIAATNMTQLIKQMAMEAVTAGKPCDIITGAVISAKPLKIRLAQKKILTEDFLILTRNVTDYETAVTITSGFSPGSHSQYTGSGEHSHTVTQGKAVIHNALKKGDQVVLLRQSGGQRYLVLDKVVRL